MSTTSGASAPDDKTATVQYKPAMSLTGNNNALAHYEQSHGYDQISHALSNIHGLYGWSCNLLDVISVYSLNLALFPGPVHSSLAVRNLHRGPGLVHHMMSAAAYITAISLRINDVIEWASAAFYIET